MITPCSSADAGARRTQPDRGDDRRRSGSATTGGRRVGRHSSGLRRGLLATLTMTLLAAMPGNAHADAFVGDFGVFAFDYCPYGWTPANGAVLSIQQNQALYSLLGTRYGGNGTTIFALPKMSAVTAAHGSVPARQLTVCIALSGVFPPRP